MSFANWLYKQTHSITHPTGVTDYQIKFTVYKGVGSSTGSSIYLNNHCKDDFSDVRFSIDNSTSLSYWIESYTSGVSAVIWVKFASILTTTVSIYYGNVLVTSESNGVNTFILFDDFLGSSLDTTTNWTLDAGSVTVTGGTAVVASGALPLYCSSLLVSQGYLFWWQMPVSVVVALLILTLPFAVVLCLE